MHPIEPTPPPPFEAGPRVLLRRGNGYALPPIGRGRKADHRHLRRQQRIGDLLLLLLVVAPFGWWFGTLLGWWGGL